MNGPATMTFTEQEAAVPSRIVRVFFYHFASFNDRSHLDRSDHSLWSRHLPQCVREVKKLLRCCLSDSILDQTVPPFSAHYIIPTHPMRQFSRVELLCARVGW